MRRSFLNKARTLSVVLTLLLTFVLIQSCSQKYDENGIFNPQDPNFYSFSTSEIDKSGGTILSKNIIYDSYVYLGKDISLSGDTTAWSDIVLKTLLPDTENLDSAYLVFKINEEDIIDPENKFIELFKTNSEWTSDSIEISEQELTIVDTAGIYRDTTESVYMLKFDLDVDDITEWSADDSTDSDLENFYIRCLDGNEFSPLVKIYSSKWAYDSQKPLLFSHSSYLDTLEATDGTDSIATVFNKDSIFISDDASLAYKKSEPITDPINFKIGGISGESWLCKINIPDSIADSLRTTTVVTGRITLNELKDLNDPVYGGIANDQNTFNELMIYVMTDSLWYSDPDSLNYDELNVWEYEIEQTDSVNYLVMDGVIQNWINNPEENFGLLFTSKNWGNPFGYSIFQKPEFNISYIRLNE